MEDPRPRHSTTRRYTCLGCLGALLLVAALMYPTFRRAAAKANQTSCDCNLKQITLGLQMYANDYDGRLPDTGLWQSALLPYYKNPSMTVCPEDSRLPWYQRNPGDRGESRVGFVSYAMAQRWSLKPLPKGAAAATAIAYYDADDTGASFRHLGGLNVDFLDGHVKSYSAEDLARTVIGTGSMPVPSPPAP